MKAVSAIPEMECNLTGEQIGNAKRNPEQNLIELECRNDVHDLNLHDSLRSASLPSSNLSQSGKEMMVRQ